MFGRAYGDEVAARHFYQDVFPVAEFQAGKRFIALFCVIGKDGYNDLHEQIVCTNHLWRVCGLSPQVTLEKRSFFLLDSGDIVPITIFFLSLVFFQERQDPLGMAS
jgi:hypothetical protein